MKCNFCNNEFEIKKFIPKSSTGKNIFEINEWFFAYVNCKCGEFIMDKEQIKERLK